MATEGVEEVVTMSGKTEEEKNQQQQEESEEVPASSNTNNIQAEDDDEDAILGTGPSAVEVSKDEEDELLGPSADDDNGDDDKNDSDDKGKAESSEGDDAMEGEDNDDDKKQPGDDGGDASSNGSTGQQLKRKRLEGEENELAGEKSKKSSIAPEDENQDDMVKNDDENNNEDDSVEVDEVADAKQKEVAGNDKDDEMINEKGESASESTDKISAPANKGFDMFKASPFAALAGKSASPFAAAGTGGPSPFASASSSGPSPFASAGTGGPSPFASAGTGGPSPFATFAGSTSGFGQLASQKGSSSIFGGNSGAASSKKKDDDDDASSNADDKSDSGMENSGSNNTNRAKTESENEPDENAVFGGEGSQAMENSAEPTDVITGEEEEECMFRTRAKLYRLTVEDPDKSGNDKSAEEPPKPVKRVYKEMGAGTVHINIPRGSEWLQDSSSAAHPPRLVMRREGVLKLLLNAVMWKNMPLELASEKVIRFTCKSVIDDHQAQGPETYVFKLPRADMCSDLYKQLMKARDMCP
mmetsp:Transcript_381/g.857  ORF Transcript_381/g.857 Transcript_381/m.857 type:complete len:529 (+) Transcript_381:577-2163(+)|eukprot:CAMPEP_0171495768 /NCGR_PEP_ID=MMETSP0958-20121227/6319_1 /TAXON_ID=87120 /ORGANISM="Aurantiochytrium limacinum, Strain ATCCMYA-1381" /LENGTH=528 /DNA_ID=CAMNT_0012029775 /DNA_START=487 /DNA_END=2073 /DNA_ORIENTATION=-